MKPLEPIYTYKVTIISKDKKKKNPEVLNLALKINSSHYQIFLNISINNKSIRNINRQAESKKRDRTYAITKGQFKLSAGV